MGIYAHSGDTCVDSDFIICPMNARRATLYSSAALSSFVSWRHPYSSEEFYFLGNLISFSFPYLVSYDVTKSTGNWELTQDEIATVT